MGSEFLLHQCGKAEYMYDVTMTTSISPELNHQLFLIRSLKFFILHHLQPLVAIGKELAF